MAGSHTFNDQVFATRANYLRAPNRKARKFALGLALATGALIAATPIVVSAVVSQPDVHTPADDTTLAAFTGRAVEVDGSVMGFRQQGDRINVTVAASDFGQRVFVQNSAGDLLEFPVSPGQTTLTAELPAAFAASEELTIRID
jgi:hypothetical protein